MLYLPVFDTVSFRREREKSALFNGVLNFCDYGSSVIDELNVNEV
jgi:hypothetical protein